MDKLQLAHEYAMVRLTTSNPKTLDEIINLAWYYADAMQKKADSRKPKGLPQALSPEVTHLNNTLAAQKMVYDDEFQSTGYEP